MDIVYKTLLMLLLQGNRPTIAYDIPYYNWPLAPGHSNLETTGHHSVGAGSCLTRDTGHPSLDYDSLRFSGKSLSFKEFTLDDTFDIKDFTFSVFVSPSGESGTIFHYEKQDQSTGIDKIKGIILSYKNNDTNLYIFGDNATDVLVNISMQNYFQNDEWTPVSVEYDEGSKEFNLWIGTDFVEYKLEIKRYLGKPGKIRIGGSFLPDNSSYYGRATCLQFYDGRLKDDFDKALLECLSTTWSSDAGEKTGYSHPLCEDTEGFYEIIRRERAPPSSTSPIANLTTSSKVRCADWCARPSNACVSFAINKSKNVCRLFDVNDIVNLVLENGTDYYVSKTRLNCC